MEDKKRVKVRCEIGGIYVDAPNIYVLMLSSVLFLGALFQHSLVEVLV